MEKTKFCWWSPSAGTQEFLAFGGLTRIQSFDYLQTVASRAEQLGFDDLLLPISPRCIDPVVAGTFLGQHTRKINLMMAFRPGHWNVLHLARALASLHLLYPGRIKVNIVEGIPAEMINENDRIENGLRYQRRDEFVELLVKLLRGELVSSCGQFFNYNNCQLAKAIIPDHPMGMFISGHTIETQLLCKNSASGNLIFGGSFRAMEQAVLSLKAVSGLTRPEVGMAINIVARETSELARAAAFNYISRVSERHLRNVALFDSAYPMVDGVSIEELKRNDYWHSELLWYGLARGRTHQRASLVGSYDQVASALKGYEKLGINYFMLTGAPNDTELMHIGQGVLPLFRCLN